MRLAWGSHPKVDAAFRSQVVAIANEIKTDPSWLMAVMAFESRLDPKAVNSISGASGLIQFMPSTAIGLDTTVEIIRNMPAGEQLALVREYLLPYAGRLNSLSDAYMSVLLPSAIGKPEDAVIFPPGSKAYLQNRGLDINHDGAVTKAEAASFVQKRYFDGMQPGNMFDGEIGSLAEVFKPDQEKPVIPLLTALLPTVLQMFAPKVQAQLTKVTGQSEDVLAPFLTSLFGSITKATGETDPVAAVAALQKSPDKVAEVEQNALDYLDKLAPVLDKISEYDKQAWAAEEASRAAAAERSRSDSSDLAPFLAYAAVGLCAFILFPLFVLMGIQVWFSPEHEPSTAMLTLVGPLLGSAFALVASVYAYRFGTSRQSGAKDVLIGEMARQSKT